MELRIGVVVTVWREVDEPIPTGIVDDDDKGRSECSKITSGARNEGVPALLVKLESSRRRGSAGSY